MKNIPFLRIALVVFAALTLHIPGNLYGALVYQDDFSANGELDGRKTAEGFGEWVAGSKLVVTDGSMVLSSSEPESESAWFPLPSLEGKSLLRVTIQCHSRGTKEGSHISFGFAPSEGIDDHDVFTKTGALWVIDRSDSFALMYWTGPGSTNQFVGEDWYGDFYRDPNVPTEHSIEYNLKTGEVTATVSNNGNTRTLVSDVPVNWAGNDRQPIPLDNLASFGVSFYKQTGMKLGEGETASITEIRIELLD